MSRRRSRRSRRARRQPHQLAVALALTAVVVVLIGGAGTLLTVLGIALGLMLVVLLAMAYVAIQAGCWLSRRMVSTPGRVPHQRGAPTVVPAAPDWHAERRRFADLRAEYGALECDPLAVLRIPALTDVRVAATARFVDAFAEAQALDTDREPPAAHATSYAAAVDRACRAWQAAKDSAERIRLAGLTPAERASVQRVIKLLTMARDSGHDAERLSAYAKARAELARLEAAGTIHLPRTALAAVDGVARGRLPA